MSRRIIIDSEKGEINIKGRIKDSGLFEVKDNDEIEGINIEKKEMVYLNVLKMKK